AFATGEYPHSVVAADINGDGKPDVVVANTGNGTISVLLNTQYQTEVFASPATATIVHDYIFADGFGP
ncbi:MAG TPA: VCBS repeat-containing protein, partial [Rudaea sp.]|nr:VCBS repeat-containing protein [Rudaea sp.]